MPVRFGPAGVPLSCKGRTIVEGMDDITNLGLETMEIQTVRTVTPQHFDQFWQAGILAWKTDFEMNIHGPYYADFLGTKRTRMRSLAKLESSLQAGKVLNAHHITTHVGPYGELPRGRESNEQVANVYAAIVERAKEIWAEDQHIEVFPWLEERDTIKIGIETSGRQELWGNLDEVLEVVNHVEGTVPVLNFGHIHARGHGCLRTSEDYGELFDKVRETIGTKEFYCHFSGVSHRMGDALHYTQIRKSDLNFEPLAQFLVSEGDWLDVTIISDSPLLEHDAMYMYLQIERSRHRLFEKKVKDERRRNLAAQVSMTPEELALREEEIANARLAESEASETKTGGDEKSTDLDDEKVAKDKDKKKQVADDDDLGLFVDEEDEDLF